MADHTRLAAGPILSTRIALACSRSVIKLTAQSTSVGTRGNGGFHIFIFMVSSTHSQPPSGDRRLITRRHSFNFCNIRGIHFNLNNVHQHLQTKSPDCLFLSETQIKAALDSTHLTFPGYSCFQISSTREVYVLTLRLHSLLVN